MTYLVAYNVRSLASRVSSLLALPYSLLLLSEVRVSSEGQKVISRRFAAGGASVVWGLPPPPSPTFRDSPGGVAIVARSPWNVRSYVLPSLRKWTQMSRVVAARAVHPEHDMVLICVYGFPGSHPGRSMNEEMLIDVFSSMATLKCLLSWVETLTRCTENQ